MDQEFIYDVFLSHSSKDRVAVRGLAERLRKDGLRVWFEEWTLRRHDRKGSKEERINRGLEQSRTLVLVMSKNAFAFERMKLESYTAIFRDTGNQQRRFIPLRLDNTEIPVTLGQFAYIDWQVPDENQYDQLLMACRPSSPKLHTGKKHHHKQTASALKSRITSKVTGRVWSVAVTLDGQLGSLSRFCVSGDNQPFSLERTRLCHRLDPSCSTSCSKTTRSRTTYSGKTDCSSNSLRRSSSAPSTAS